MIASKKEFTWSWSRFAKDAVIILVLTLAYNYVFHCISYGVPSLKHTIVPMMWNLGDVPAILAAFVIGIRVLRSPLAFFAISIAITAWRFARQVNVASEMGLTKRVMGIDIYKAGELTSEGVIYELLKDPIVFAVPYALFLIGMSYRKQLANKQGYS